MHIFNVVKLDETMKMPGKIDAEMIAPCGLNCLACNAHLNSKTPCPGCRAPVEKITRKSCRECLIKKCAFEKGVKWCFECMSFPCSKIEKLNKRYSQKYDVYLIENASGAKWDIPEFLQSQKELFTCKSCNGIINQHRKRCSDCEQGANFLTPVLEKIKNRKSIFILDMDDYKDRKNLIKKLEAAFGNEHIFRHAMLKLLKEHEKKATAFGLYFGYQQDPINFAEISKILNLSSARVGVLCNAAFRRLIAPRFFKEVWAEYGYKEKE